MARRSEDTLHSLHGNGRQRVPAKSASRQPVLLSSRRPAGRRCWPRERLCNPFYWLGHAAKMAHLLLLRFEITGEEMVRLNFETHALNYLQARLAQCANLRRIVRHHAHRAQAKIEQDFGALIVAPQVSFEAEPLIGFDGVGTLVLQRIRADLVDDADAAPFLLLVDDRAVPFLLDQLHRRFELSAAVALDRAKHIARHALRVNTHKAWLVRAQLAFDEHNELFLGDERAETDNAKLSRLRRQACFRNPLDCS